MLQIFCPPKTRGIVLTGSSDKVLFLDWNKFTKAFETMPDSEIVRNCIDTIWERISNYNPNKEVLHGHFTFGKTVDFKLKVLERPLLLEDIAEETKIPLDKVISAFNLYEEGCYTPEDAAIAVGISIKKLMILSEFFQKDNFLVPGPSPLTQSDN